MINPRGDAQPCEIADRGLDFQRHDYIQAAGAAGTAALGAAAPGAAAAGLLTGHAPQRHPAQAGAT